MRKREIEKLLQRAVAEALGVERTPAASQDHQLGTTPGRTTDQFRTAA
jgi:hypothetical protein